MSRFLSAAKLSLLILIDLYHHGETRTSDIVPLLSFISHHIVRKDEPSLSSFNAFDVLNTFGSAFPGRTLHDVYLNYIWRLRTFNQLAELFAQDRSATSDKLIPIVPTSPLGLYLRRCQLEFIRLQFSDAQQLWEDFLIFREASWPAWASYKPDEAAGFNESDDTYASPIMIDRQEKRILDGQDALLSQDVLDRTVQFQLDKMQATGCRVSPEVRRNLASMIQHSSSKPADAYFIRFFDSWRAGVYNDAIDNLHRYFDYAMENHGAQQDIKTYHQYALLHLAVLHADFGCFEEATAAMDECIAIARENHDSRCLNFALSWLVHLRRTHPEYVRHERLLQEEVHSGRESDILSYLEHKALEDKDWTQLSNSLLTHAELTVQDGLSMAKAMEYSIQSRHLNLKYHLRPLRMHQLRLHSALFAQCGAHACAEQQIDTTIAETAIYPDVASRSETLAVACTRAYQLSLAGDYDAARRTLLECDPARCGILKMQNLHLGVASMIELKRSLHRDDLKAAEQLLIRVKYLRTIAEPDMAFETHVLELDFLRRSGRTHAALDKATGMLKDARTNEEATGLAYAHRVRLLIATAELWAAADQATNGFSVAVRAANAAFLRHRQPLLWAAVAALAHILNDLEEYDAARELLEAVLPAALEGGDGYLVARLYSFLGDALVGLAMGTTSAVDHESEETRDEADWERRQAVAREQLLNKALTYIERARIAFARMEDRQGTHDCLAKKALLYRSRGETALADEMDKMVEAAEIELVDQESDVESMSSGPGPETETMELRGRA